MSIVVNNGPIDFYCYETLPPYNSPLAQTAAASSHVYGAPTATGSSNAYDSHSETDSSDNCDSQSETESSTSEDYQKVTPVQRFMRQRPELALQDDLNLFENYAQALTDQLCPPSPTIPNRVVSGLEDALTQMIAAERVWRPALEQALKQSEMEQKAWQELHTADKSNLYKHIFDANNTVVFRPQNATPSDMEVDFTSDD